MKQLVLIRHGESEWNRLNLFTGWTLIWPIRVILNGPFTHWMPF